MKNMGLLIGGFLVVVIAVVLFGSVFTVHQTEQALVLRFGKVVRLETEPGLKFKVPMIDNVAYFDRRLLPLDPPVQELALVDQKRINVDAFARYRIVDPLKLYQTVGNEAQLRDRFGAILNAAVRDAVANAQLTDLLGDARVQVMANITAAVQPSAPRFGIEVVDVRIGRTDLPEATSQSVFNRMRSERVAQAAKLRAEGAEINARIKAQADRERTVILAEAQRQADILRGEGEGRRNAILGEAYGKDPEFFSFIRSLEAYRQSLANGSTTLLLSPDSEFFRYFGHDEKGGAPTPR